MPEAVNQPQVMEGPAGGLRCPAPGTLVQRPADHIQSGAGPLGNNVQNPAQRLAPLLHLGGSLQPSLPAPNHGVVSSNIKVCESSNLELTHPMVVAISRRHCIHGTTLRDNIESAGILVHKTDMLGQEVSSPLQYSPGRCKRWSLSLKIL